MEKRGYGPFPYSPITERPKLSWPGGARVAVLLSFDVDNETAVATRHRMFGEYADSPTLIIGTHFAGPTAGKLVRDGDTYRLDV